MSGWLALRLDDRSVADEAAVEQSLAGAERQGCAIERQSEEGLFIAAWRRASGEFPLSGSLARSGRATGAFVGQCLDDAGDQSHAARTLLADSQARDEALANLNGPFAFASIDRESQTLRIVTDRYRHYPVYVANLPGLLVASTEFASVLPWLSDPRINADGADMFLRCGELIDRDTLLQGVELLPPGIVLEADARGVHERRYWTMRHEERAGVDFDDEAAELSELLRRAVRRIERATPRMGITLSGGLDSRVVLDLCDHPERVPSFTWGAPGCRDITCARAFAKAVGSPHTIRHWEPGAFPPLWSTGVRLTAGSFGIESMYMLPFTGLLAESCDVILSGLAGDAILGGNFLKQPWLGERDTRRLGDASWRWRVTPAEDEIADRMTGRRAGSSSSAARWSASVAARDGARPVERLNDWLYENRVFRNTNSGTMLLRSRVESHAPFFDRDFLDRVIRVRQEHKLKHRLYLKVMEIGCPRAAAVPWQRTNLPPAWGFAANVGSMVAQRVATRALGPIGVKPFPRLAVARPDRWLREQWRESAGSIVLSESLASRGILDGSIVRDVWERHQRGENFTRMLGAIISFELFCRWAVDRKGRQAA